MAYVKAPCSQRRNQPLGETPTPTDLSIEISSILDLLN
jgi:hypothetical protein